MPHRAKKLRTQNRSATGAQKVLETEQVLVYDNLLPAAQFQEVLRFCNAEEFTVVHQKNWRKVWRLHDGFPLQGKTYYHDSGEVSGGDGIPYPTGKFVDLVFEAIMDLMPYASRVVGKREDEWVRMSAAAWVYPPNSGLSLHCDGDQYTGAFTYFVHPQWNLHWGGLLIVLDPQTKNDRLVSPEFQHPWLNDDAENAAVWDPGLALCILPKPNRIVFIGPDAQHLVTKVETTAGQHARVSLAGFFIRPRD